MHKIAIAVHGGASDDTIYMERHRKKIERGLESAVMAGYSLLKNGCSALDAVEHAVKRLEDNPIFNAGRGSALNFKGEVEMDASIMDGKTLKAGAVSMVRNVKNPISLARDVMKNTHHVFLSGYGALEFARTSDIELEPDSYFITDHMYDEYRKENKQLTIQRIMEKRMIGTVGAVALDNWGNVAAGTSTGGTTNCLPGRIGDSCIIGAGCYANNKTCAVSGTGTGEVLIVNVVGNTISMLMQLKKYKLQKACEEVIALTADPNDPGIGVISVDVNGNIGIAHNTQIMKKAWVDVRGNLYVEGK